MRFPCSTGEAAKLIGTTEPRLAETVRRGQVNPEPTVMAGRRLWFPEQLRQAAVALDIPTDALDAVLGSANTSQSQSPQGGHDDQPNTGV